MLHYSFDTHTKKRESLTTSTAAEAQRLVDARNEAVQHVEMNRQPRSIYLQHKDLPTLTARTWQDVARRRLITPKTGSTRETVGKRAITGQSV